MTGGLLSILLPMVPRRLILGLGPVATAVGIVTLPKMVMLPQVQDRTPAAAAPLTECHPHHLVLVMIMVIDFRLLVKKPFVP